MRRPALLLLVVGLALPASAQGSFPGANGKIAFTEFNGGGPGGCIMSVNADGSDKAQATPCPYRFYLSKPAWAADGRRLAYEDDSGADDEVRYVTDGQNPTRAWSSGVGTTGLGWSPDGGRLAVTYGYSNALGDIFSGLVIVKSDGSHYDEIQSSHTTFFTSPDWSPDGTKIAFNNYALDLMTVNPDGSGLATIASNVREPSWSPDRQKIAFGRNLDIWVMKADGTNQTQLTSGPSREGDPTWSPDGSKIAFQSTRDTPNGTSCGGYPDYCVFDIFVMNADGSNQTNVTNTPTADEGQPSWQPIPINGYPRPKGATPVLTALAVAYKPCIAQNRTHGPPLSAGSCNPPTQSSDYLTVGTLDSNGQKAGATAWVRQDVRVGNPSTPADEADVQLRLSLSDVRNKDLSDYPGELSVQSSRRITDKDSTPAPNGGTGAATVQDLPLSITVPCAATSDTTIGSLCALDTTADTLVPGSVKEDRRSIWELSQVLVYDGGADQDADTTSDNTLFLDQGIFVP